MCVRSFRLENLAVFWVVAPCSLVDVYQRFRGIALMMEVASTSEMLVNFYQTTLRNNPEDSHLRTHRRENLKSNFIVLIREQVWKTL
jgi:hypothetical protein